MATSVDTPPSHQIVRIRYTNYRGECAYRTIIPQNIRFGATEWHPTEQWLLEAWDLDKQQTRSFAMSDISEWHRQDEAQKD